MRDLQDKEPTLGLGQQVAKGVGLLVFTRLVLRSLGLVSTIVLARLLLPEDFGLVAVTTAFVGMIQGVAEFGFNSALIKFQTKDRRDFDTAWTLNLIRGAILSLIVIIGAFALPLMLDEPRIGPVLFLMSLLPFIRGIQNSKFIVFERSLDFSREFIVVVCAKVLAVLVTITIAVIWRNYWALICGVMVGSVVQLIMGYVLMPYKPRISFHSTRKLFSFAIWIVGNHSIGAIAYNIDKFIAGTLLGVGYTGQYYMGQEISALLTRELFQPVKRALYPGFVKISADVNKLRVNVIESIGIFAGIGLPIGFGFSFVAQEFVPLVLGMKWTMIVPMVQVLAPVLGIQTITTVAHGALMSLGETRAIFFRGLVGFVIRLPLLVVGGVLWGFQGLFFSLAIAGFIDFLLNYFLLVTRIGCSPLAPLKSARRSIIALGAMSVALFVCQPYLPDASSGELGLLGLVLSLKIVVGVGVYCGSHFILWVYAGKPAGIESRLLRITGEVKSKVRGTFFGAK